MVQPDSGRYTTHVASPGPAVSLRAERQGAGPVVLAVQITCPYFPLEMNTTPSRPAKCRSLVITWHSSIRAVA